MKIDHSTLGNVIISHIFSNRNDFEAVFRPPGFVISYVIPAFNLDSLLKNCNGLFFVNYELLLLEGVCISICICYSILLLTRNVEIGLILD